MKRTTKPKREKKLLVSVQNVRSLDGGKLRAVNGGACPRSKPVNTP